MTGGLSAPCALVALYVSDDTAKRIWALLAIVALWIASFHAWRLERAADNEKAALLDDRVERKNKREVVGEAIEAGNRLFRQVVWTQEEFDAFERAVDLWRDDTKKKINDEISPADAARFWMISATREGRFKYAFNDLDNSIRFGIDQYLKNLADIMDRYS